MARTYNDKQSFHQKPHRHLSITSGELQLLEAEMCPDEEGIIVDLEDLEDLPLPPVYYFSYEGYQRVKQPQESFKPPKQYNPWD